MTPAPHRWDAVAGTCPFGSGRISTHLCGSGIDNCISRSAVNLPKRRTWL